jgi:stalled ribosome rescue protein Dom34
MPSHVAIWIDHKEARIFHIHPDRITEVTVEAPAPVHRKHSDGHPTHPDDAKHFFGKVVGSVEGVDEILIVGPSTAKLEFMRYLREHAHALEPKVIGIETVDHPTDGQLVAYAMKYFKRSDRMR